MRSDSLLLNLHYPSVSQKPNTYNQLESATAPSPLAVTLLCLRLAEIRPSTGLEWGPLSHQNKYKYRALGCSRTGFQSGPFNWCE